MNSNRHYRKIQLIVSAAAILLLSGCAQMQLGTPAATMENVQRARAGVSKPVSIGQFVPAKELDPQYDASFNLRSNTLTAPTESSFARYLRETLVVELSAAGLLDQASPLVVQGQLTQSKLEAPIGTGNAELAARFQVLNVGTLIYDRELREASTWNSPFLGAVAIPAAANEYTALFRKLVARLFDDPDFLLALKK